MPKSPLTRLEKARILVQQGGKNKSGHVVLDGAVRKIRSVTLAITFGALPVTRFAVLRLADASQKSVPGDLNVVERTAGDYLEFLPDRERRDLSCIFQSQEIWQCVEQPVIRRAFLEWLRVWDILAVLR